MNDEFTGSTNKKIIQGRREFLRKISAGTVTAAGGGMGIKRGYSASKNEESKHLPTIKIGPYSLSRLIMGSNPILGYSHSSRLLTQHMLEYYTLEKTVEVIRRSEQLGINTWQTGCSQKIIDAIRILREQGSTIHWICLCAEGENYPSPKELAALKPIAVVHHGGVTDRCFRSQESEKVHDYVKKIHDAGLLAGVSAHNPANIAHIGEKDWENDFFMTCFYYVTRPREEMREKMGTAPLGEPFLEDDPEDMTKVVRDIKKPCLGFKILAAGRLCQREQTVEAAFQYAFSRIKKTDGVIVGMYPRFKDEISENIQYTLKHGMDI